MTTDHHATPPTVQLVPLPTAALAAMLAGDLPRASAAAGVPLPPFFLTQDWLWRYRLDQMQASPAAAPWLVRAVYDPRAGVVVGHAGFHGPPDAHGMVEIGYTTLPEYRRRGYARAAVRELVRYAAQAGGVRVVRASISPENVASLSLVRSMGFAHVGEQWDEEDGRELILERPLPSSVDAPDAAQR